MPGSPVRPTPRGRQDDGSVVEEAGRRYPGPDQRGVGRVSWPPWSAVGQDGVQDVAGAKDRHHFQFEHAVGSARGRSDSVVDASVARDEAGRDVNRSHESSSPLDGREEG